MTAATIQITSKEDFYNLRTNTIAYYDENDTLKSILEDIELNHMVIDDIIYNEFSSRNRIFITILVKEKYPTEDPDDELPF